MGRKTDREFAERRFRSVFSHLGAVTDYAWRRGSADAEAIAAETMAIAWRRLADVPTGDPRPWLYATARNLVWVEVRKAGRSAAAHVREREQSVPPPEVVMLDPELGEALRSLSRLDQEALFLVTWEDLTPAQAAVSLGINPAAFRVRLLRARRRLRASLVESSPESRRQAPPTRVDVEGTK
jgi:DNA-directed RNA polymerase specialized sigma24 family protein